MASDEILSVRNQAPTATAGQHIKQRARPDSPSTLMTVPLSLAIELQVSPGAATTTSLQKAMVLPVQTALPA